jgi:hypothetical protein
MVTAWRIPTAWTSPARTDPASACVGQVDLPCKIDRSQYMIEIKSAERSKIGFDPRVGAREKLVQSVSLPESPLKNVENHSSQRRTS